MGIRLSGISTGLDTDALVKSIMDLERRPLNLVKQRISELESQKALVSDFTDKLEVLRDAAAAIDNRGTTYTTASVDEELLSYQAKSSDDASVHATASGNAAPGSVSLRVVNLAASARRVSNAFASSTTPIGNAGDTLSVTFGASTISYVVPTGGASLADIKAAINGDANNDGSVRADVLFDGAGYRLIVRGSQTGAANDVTLATTLTGPTGGAFLDAAASQSARDATLQVFGLQATRPSNTVTDLVPGLTLELKAPTAAAVDVAVSLDADAVAKKLEAFAKAYNDVVDFIARQSLYDEKTKKAGALSGDSTLRTVQTSVRQTIFGDWLAGTFGGLTDIGVRFDDEKHLTVDREDLEAALSADANGVRGLLGGLSAKQGLAGQLAQVIDKFVKSDVRRYDPGPGLEPIFTEVALLPARAVANDASIKALQAQVTRLEDRLAKRQEYLVAQFTRMESLVTQLRGQGNSLNGITTVSLLSSSSS